MFYQCPKCRRRWEYPLNECPYDFAPLAIMKSATAKVASSAKVSIATLLHPAPPYYVLLLKDENDNFWVHKSEKEFKLGEEFQTESIPADNAVAIWRVKYNPKEAISKVLELIGGLKVNADSKIFILPTITASSYEYFRDNTSPRFLDAVLSLLVERGVKTANITVGTQSFDEVPLSVAAQKSGLLALAGKYKIMPQDLAEAEYTKMGQFEIVKSASEADLIINLAMEKMGQASSAQNMFRLLKKQNYLGLQYLSSDEEIAKKLEKIFNKMIVIGEAENVQRSCKLTTFLGLVLAAKNPCYLDRVFNEAAQALKLPEIIKNCNMESIAVVGRSIREVQYQAEIY